MLKEYRLELKRLRAELKACQQEERAIQHSSNATLTAVEKAQREVNKQLKAAEHDRNLQLRGLEVKRQTLAKRESMLKGRIAS